MGTTGGLGEEDWRHARLLPTYGLRSQDEQEKRATSCLLAVMHGVPEFGHAVLRDLGAPKSPVIETYAEVRFKRADGKLDVPDGAIVCQRGSKRWACLVEVKTGSAQLKPEQVERYVDVARERGFDGVLTISGQITHSPSESPVDIDKRKLGKMHLWHLSWWRIMTEAVVQSRYRGVTDPDQAWVLRELIHYLGSDASGAVGLEDMGAHWVPVRTAARNGTLRQDDGVCDVAERWEQLTEYLCLSLAQELGRDVRVLRPRGQTTRERLELAVKSLANGATLEATIRVPDAVGDIAIVADLKSRQVAVSVEVVAPNEGRVKSRISWILRQLTEASPDLRIEVRYPHSRENVASTLGHALEQPDALLCPSDPRREPKSFILTMTRPLGQKRGRGERSFVRETRLQTVVFYRDLVQGLRPWQPRAPRMREPADGVEDRENSAPDLLPLRSVDEFQALAAEQRPDGSVSSEAPTEQPSPTRPATEGDAVLTSGTVPGQ